MFFQLHFTYLLFLEAFIMGKRTNDYIIVLIAVFVSIILSVLSFNDRMERNALLLIIYMVVIFVIVYIFWIRLRFNRKNKEINTLSKLLEYSKKRTEIEEEIRLLTKQLERSDLSEYLDMNRLVFAGQNEIGRNVGINYNSFLTQFGLLNEEIEVRKNSAVFLTPFNTEGEELFRECQKILSDLDIFLQKTDNYVEKEDILMNVVSLIVKSEIIIVNINGRNPNVYYELGIAHAIGKPTILLSKIDFGLDDIGFDIRQKRIIMYRSSKDLEQQLLYQVSRIKSKEI